MPRRNCGLAEKASKGDCGLMPQALQPDDMNAKANAYLVGGGIGSLAAAAFMIRDGSLKINEASTQRSLGVLLAAPQRCDEAVRRLIPPQVFGRHIVLGDLLGVNFSHVWVRRIFHSANGFGLKGLPLLEQFFDAL